MGNQTDRFGNPFAPTLSYARGKILSSTEDDFRKLQHAWSLVRQRGPENIFIFTGLDHSLPMTPEDLRWADDEIAPALYFDRMKALALDHLGGSADRHDIMVFNRLTGATLATHLTFVEPGDVVVGVSASHSHPSVIRAAAHVGARFTDTAGLDEYGTLGPRFGLMGGDRALVARVRAKAFECGLECRQMLYPAVVRTLERYSPKRVQELIDTTKAVAVSLRQTLGGRLHETPTTAQLLADDLLEIAMARG